MTRKNKDTTPLEREYTISGFVAFEFGIERLGWLRPKFVEYLRHWPEYFDVLRDRVVLSSALHTREHRTAALARCTRTLARAGIVTGWRNETYAIRSTHDDAPLLDIERAAMHRFGLTAYGANLNAYVEDGTSLRMWIARRSMSKPVDPGLLDSLVGGGIASGYTAWETLLKESGEEAGIPSDLALQARPAGQVRSLRTVPDGLHSEIVFVYDLLLPSTFVPVNSDGEVCEFYLASVRNVLTWLEHEDFSVEADLVTRDFLRRHDSVTADLSHSRAYSSPTDHEPGNS